MFPKDKFKEITTPFYFYDTQLLQKTLDAINSEVAKHDNYHVHYAVKANANPKILHIIQQNGFGADCVSGGEISAVLSAGFKPADIVFAGVGKSDWEIKLALENEISCFNVESVPELEVINNIASMLEVDLGWIMTTQTQTVFQISNHTLKHIRRILTCVTGRACILN